MTGLRNSGNAVPDPDALSQFNVQTNNFSAQLGRYAAAVVSIVTKSGTNEFHGSAFEFYRTRNFTATAHNALVKPAYARNEFGATVGGPIRRNKDFFFGSFGGPASGRYPVAYSGNVPDTYRLRATLLRRTSLPTDMSQACIARVPVRRRQHQFPSFWFATRPQPANNTVSQKYHQYDY